MIKAGHGRAKKGQRVMHFIAPNKAGFELPRVVLNHVGEGKTKTLCVKALHDFHLLCAKCEML